MWIFLHNPISDSSHKGLHLPVVWSLLPFSAAIVRVTQEPPPNLSRRCSKPLWLHSYSSVFLPGLGECCRHSYLTLLTHWPSSLDMQSNSQWPYSTSPSPNHVIGGTPPFVGTSIIPVTFSAFLEQCWRADFNICSSWRAILLWHHLATVWCKWDTLKKSPKFIKLVLHLVKPDFFLLKKYIDNSMMYFSCYFSVIKTMRMRI